MLIQGSVLFMYKFTKCDEILFVRCPHDSSLFVYTSQKRDGKILYVVFMIRYCSSVYIFLKVGSDIMYSNEVSDIYIIHLEIVYAMYSNPILFV